MRKFIYLVGAVLLCQGSLATASKASDSILPEICGVFGVAPVPENTAFAIWVPLEPGNSVSGVSWYHNDEEVVFPQLSAIAGEYGHPDLLELATIVATGVSGVSSGWSSCTFSRPLASESAGIYIIFEFPEGAAFDGEGRGGGAGVGYINGDNVNTGWITGDGLNWGPLSASLQMAIVPITSQDKAAGVLVLAVPGNDGSEDIVQDEDILESPERLRAYPNPFNPAAEIWFSIPSDGQVDISVFDVKGRLVRRLMSDRLSAGEHYVTWDGRNSEGGAVASGVYLVLMRTKTLHRSLRVTLLQ